MRDSGKHSSLLHKGVIYAQKMFYEMVTLPLFGQIFDLVLVRDVKDFGLFLYL